ncbi:MAG: DNA polymerase III subunit delta' [Chloroflexota bacterium]
MSNAWDDIVGHQWAKELLSGAIMHNRVGHAYLITGPAHIGKTTLARTFAQALNCEAQDVAKRPCGQCRACQLIASDRHPDVRLVAPTVSGRGRALIKIDAIRQLQQALSLSAYEGRYKVAILTQFDTANINAANAFLKTLEEPPNNVILLLTASDADTLLETITSRCRTVGLRPLSTPLIQESLQTHWQVPPQDAHLLAHVADGRLGWAIMAHQDSSILKVRHQELEKLAEVLNGRRVERFAVAEKLFRKPETLRSLLQTWLSWWRDLLILSKRPGSEAQLTNIDQSEQLDAMAQGCTTDQILASLKQTSLALWQLQRNANIRLVLENLFLTYPYRT